MNLEDIYHFSPSRLSPEEIAQIEREKWEWFECDLLFPEVVLFGEVIQWAQAEEWGNS